MSEQTGKQMIKHAKNVTGIFQYDTRNKTDLQIPGLNLDFSRKSFTYTGDQ